MQEYGYIYENYLAVKSEIEELSRSVGRNIALVVVTKSGTDEELIALARAGATDIGENRPGELRRRADILSAEGFSPRLHEIGNLQRNKVKYIARDVSLIHSLDSVELAREIDRQAKKNGRKIPVLIEINSARESQKGGILPEDAEHFLLELGAFDSIEVAGLMTMGPVCENPENIRPYFKLTRELFDRLKEQYGFAHGGILSMGMSDSYRIAIEEGSTLVRIGRRFFEK